MFFSIKDCNFAPVIELYRHIEILLLSNDCVIVPDFGGFLAHYVSANFNHEENLFFPPTRTIGFNPQLKLNDHLLVQSYVEAYDISYPEALRRIEDEVKEIKQHLENEGFYELNDLGTLSVNEDGNYQFNPCEAGILTPNLYGFSSFEINPLEAPKEGKVTNSSEVVPIQVKPEGEAFNTEVESDDVDDESENAIVIKMSWMRNIVATAVAILLFFVISTPVENSQIPNTQQSSILSVSMGTDTDSQEATKTEEEATVDSTDYLATMSTEVNSDSVTTANIEQEQDVKEEIQEIAQAKEIKEITTKATRPSSYYTICLASETTRNLAEIYLKKMQKEGISDIKIIKMNNTHKVRVVCGSYHSSEEAHSGLQQYRASQSGFGEAWILHVTD